MLTPRELASGAAAVVNRREKTPDIVADAVAIPGDDEVPFTVAATEGLPWSPAVVVLTWTASSSGVPAGSEPASIDLAIEPPGEDGIALRVEGDPGRSARRGGSKVNALCRTPLAL